MADISMKVTVSRTLLGLTPLDINDHDTYRIAPGSMGSQVSWQRQSVSSPFMEDEVTISRRRGKVMEPLVIEVLGDTDAKLRQALDNLITAFIQDSFSLTLTMNGVIYAYGAEAADYQVSWTGPRFKARQLQVNLQVPRSPVPINTAVV